MERPENAAKASSTSLIGASVHVTEIRRASWRGAGRAVAAGASVVGSKPGESAEDHGSKSPVGFSSAIRSPRGSEAMLKPSGCSRTKTSRTTSSEYWLERMERMPPRFSAAYSPWGRACWAPSRSTTRRWGPSMVNSRYSMSPSTEMRTLVCEAIGVIVTSVTGPPRARSVPAQRANIDVMGCLPGAWIRRPSFWGSDRRTPRR